MSSAQVKEGFNKAIIPIMAIFALGASQGGVNAGLATMGAAFPEAGPNIGYVISMVALGMIPSGIISGAVTGRFIKYRTSFQVAGRSSWGVASRSACCWSRASCSASR